MKVSTPGSAVSIFCMNPGESSTDCADRQVAGLQREVLGLGGAVSQSRNFSAAETRSAPLLKITQLSGPEIVWWPPLAPGKAGMTCTPYFTFGKPDRSHGPVTSMPILPELNRLRVGRSRSGPGTSTCR